MATVPISLGIAGDTVTAVSVTTLTRSDTGKDAGIALPINLTLSGGLWTGSFTDASPPPYYNAVATITFSDSTTVTTPAFQLQSGSTSAGVYGDISDIMAEMGGFNTQQAADPDNAGDPAQISLHEQKAIAFADSRINGRLSDAKFATPATVNLDRLKWIFGKYGAYQLYQVKGLQDKTNAFLQKLQDADTELEEMLFMNRGGFTRVSGYSDAPTGIAASVNEDDKPVSTFPTLYFDGFIWRWG